MRVQVLAATTDQTDYSILDKLNIQSDAIIVNQCSQNKFETFEYRGHVIQWMSLRERGVGLNRNNALMRAEGDICLFADDDMTYVENYAGIVTDVFKKFPDADVIIFNLIEQRPTRYINRKEKRINYLNYLRYGTARIAIRTKKIRENAIYFNQCYGGGTIHRHGEDSLFLTSCLKCGLKMYAVPIDLARLTEERASSWNVGYDDKYFVDQGFLYHAISKRFWILLCLQDAIRHERMYGRKWISTFQLMLSHRKNKED